MTKRKKKMKFFNTEQLKKIIGKKELKCFQNSVQRGFYHFRYKNKYDIHYIGKNQYIIEKKKKINDPLFK